MKVVGDLSLFLSKISMSPTCQAGCYQPKCPDELLK
ncbi:cyclic lactone autoinducer peptide [Clostridium ljungdahlii]|nr:MULTISPECIES: cyclic lactone autoinducer peptide [Clostridium]